MYRDRNKGNKRDKSVREIEKIIYWINKLERAWENKVTNINYSGITILTQINRNKEDWNFTEWNKKNKCLKTIINEKLTHLKNVTIRQKCIIVT